MRSIDVFPHHEVPAGLLIGRKGRETDTYRGQDVARECPGHAPPPKAPTGSPNPNCEVLAGRVALWRLTPRPAVRVARRGQDGRPQALGPRRRRDARRLCRAAPRRFPKRRHARWCRVLEPEHGLPRLPPPRGRGPAPAPGTADAKRGRRALAVALPPRRRRRPARPARPDADAPSRPAARHRRGRLGNRICKRVRPGSERRPRSVDLTDRATVTIGQIARSCRAPPNRRHPGSTAWKEKTMRHRATLHDRSD